MTFAENINRICAERGTNLTAVIKQIKNGQSSYTTAINKRGSIPNQEELLAPVSYTHLDVYKRQGAYRLS